MILEKSNLQTVQAKSELKVVRLDFLGLIPPQFEQ